MNVKRKFNALLQGIGNRPSPSTTAAAATPDDGRPKNDHDAPGHGEPSAHRATTTTTTTTTPHSSLSSIPSMADEIHMLAKKRRLGTAQGRSTTTTDGGGGDDGQHHGDPALRQPATNVSDVVLRTWSPAAPSSSSASSSAAVGASRYAPADRGQLLRRLATFQELTDWTPKPEPVSEIEWAKRGWVCRGQERVRCTLCSRELVVGLNRREVDGRAVSVLVPSEIEAALVDKYAELMVTSHQEDCLWRKKGCDDALLRLPLAQAKTVLRDLRQRYDELCARRHFLPYEFNLRLPARLDLDAVLSYLPPDFFTAPPPAPATAPPPASAPAPAPAPTTTREQQQPQQQQPPPPVPPPPNRPALALAVLGWQGLSDPRIGPVPNTASCHTCLRRLGLWMFKSKEVDPATGDVLVPAPMDHLDPLREHRFFCPWKNGEAQRNPASARQGTRGDDDDALPGWEVLVRVLRNDAFLRSRAAAAHGRSKSASAAASQGPGANGAALSTPGRPTTAGSTGSTVEPTTPAGLAEREDGGGGGGDGGDEDDDEATRAAKDKERWARLRKVKSLFNTKAAAGKLKKAVGSRPGTGHSTLGTRPGTAGTAGG